MQAEFVNHTLALHFKKQDIITSDIEYDVMAANLTEQLARQERCVAVELYHFSSNLTNVDIALYHFGFDKIETAF